MFIFECNHCQTRIDHIIKRTTEIRTIQVAIDPCTGQTNDVEFSEELEATKDVEYECPACYRTFDSRDEFTKYLDE